LRYLRDDNAPFPCFVFKFAFCSATILVFIPYPLRDHRRAPAEAHYADNSGPHQVVGAGVRAYLFLELFEAGNKLRM